MTPAINILKKRKIKHKIHEYTHDPASESYGGEAAEKLGVDPIHVFKTLVADLGDKNFAVAIVPVSFQLNLKQFAKAAEVKKAFMADKHDVERVTGYVLGGVSPLGQKKRLKTVIDDSARKLDTMFVSAGRRGLEIEISPDDLKTLTGGIFCHIV